MNLKTFKKDEVIFRQGDVSNGMYDILSGSVGIYVNFGTGNETQLTVLKRGQFLGEMGMIEAYPRSATAVAMEDGTELREIGEREFGEFFSNQPERLLAIMRQLSERLRDRTADYEAACQVLEGLKATEKEPEKRSKSLLEKMKKLMDLYDDLMRECNGNYTEGYYYPHHFSIY
ncbi:MAG: cyclic nucleotide-binding domain-containing protein [Oscillospiraceae bacterium]|nr:cyclic nucleotide-binding domain-containing protein [Oscillospiraceae bacterium]